MKSESRLSAPMLWVPLLFVLLALGLRWMKLNSDGMSLLPNFSPWMALAFTGTLVFPRKTFPWWSWPVMFIAVDFLAMGGSFWTMVTQYPDAALPYALYGAAALLASQWRGKIGVAQSLIGVVGCSLAFYGLTNALAWWISPGYVKDLSGLVQSLTTGLPGLPPTWMFFRNSLLSDLGFSALLLAAYNAEAKVRDVPMLRWATA
jgi:hypothetical protein